MFPSLHHRQLFWALLAFLTTALSSVHGAFAQTGESDPLSLWRVRGEYLLWWSNGNPLPPLVSTSPPGTDRTEAGVLGTPGAEILFGNETIDTGARSGGRITLTRWLESYSDTGIEFVGFYVGDDYQSGNFVRESQGDPILSRPFFN